MSSLALIVTAYGHRGTQNLPEMIAAVGDQTRQPDEVWWMTEAIDAPSVIDLPTPRDESGRYAVIPYSNKINLALDRTECDYIAYMTDDSWPSFDKYERMAAALDANPEWGAVYCAQKRNGGISGDQGTVPDAHCRIDHTQVMHRRTPDRWPLDVRDIRTGDAEFWRLLHARLGPFYFVPDCLDVVEQTQDGITAKADPLQP